MGYGPVGVELEGGKGGEGEGEGVSVVGSGVDDEVFKMGAYLEAVLAFPGVVVVDFHGDDCWLRRLGCGLSGCHVGRAARNEW